jgi:uncharacterized GH25 family protein
MRIYWIVVLCLGLAIIFLVGLAHAQSRIKRVTQSTSTQSAESQEAKQITCTGKVVDAQGRPIAGAKVRLYERYARPAYSFDIRLAGEATTGTGGAFSFSTSAEGESYRYGYIVVEKEGLALGFDNWNKREGNKELEIKLGRGKELAGIVVDQSDKPVSDAQVSISVLKIGEGEEQRGLGGLVAAKLFTLTTDPAGNFKFTKIPAEATAEFIVKKEGRATVSTYQRTRFAGQKLKFVPGQTDIKLVLPVEAKIEGIVVQKSTGKSISGVQVMITSEQDLPLFRPKPLISNEDGTFSIGALVSDRYILQLVPRSEGLADWAAEPVEVITEAGKTKSGIKVELSKGGVLEVAVTEAVSKQPVEKASVSIRDARSNQWLSAISNEDGIARIRLMPGGYQLSGVYMQGYTSDRQQEAITIEQGSTKRVTRTLRESPKLRGVVRDVAGRPLEGVEFKVLPGGREEVNSDSEGKFEVVCDRRGWSESEDTIFCLVARHEQRNLAAVEEIGEDIKRLDIKLAPGVTFAGKVVDSDNKGIAGAKVRVMLRLSNWGSSLSRRQAETDDTGNFEIRAIPAGQNYNIYASAEGYGQKDVKAHADNAVDNHLNIETLTLPAANLSVTGQIVDTQGNPVSHARVEGSGEDQPRPNTLSDMQGNFTLDGLCAGLVYIRIDVERSGKRLSARIHTDAGLTGIKIIVREGRPVSYYIGPKTYEQIIQGSDKVIAGMAVDENGSPVADVPVGVCCIKRERQKGKFSWHFSSYSTLSDITDEQGRFAIELEEDAEYNLRFSPDKHAAVIAYDVPIGKKDLKVTLPDGGTVIGRLVRMEKGKKVPIPNAEVKVEQTSRAAYTHLGFDRDRTTVTDSQGRFRFEHLRAKIRPSESRNEKQWEHNPRVWKISFGDTSKTIAFYEDKTIEDFELLVRPDIANAQPLAGRPLPGFDGIKIDLTAEQTKDKMILVCFFDMNQRPSRHCLTQLSTRAQELKAKDFFIIAIQAAKVSSDELNTLVKESGISFPVGTIEGDVNETRFNWSVRSLPWLILTDTEHIVRADGFGINELNEKIRSMANVKR